MKVSVQQEVCRPELECGTPLSEAVVEGGSLPSATDQPQAPVMPKLAISTEENTEAVRKAQLRAHSRWHWGLRIFFYDFLYLFLAVLDLPCCEGFSLIAVTGCSLVAVLWLLVIVASPAEHRL